MVTILVLGVVVATGMVAATPGADAEMVADSPRRTPLDLTAASTARSSTGKLSVDSANSSAGDDPKVESPMAVDRAGHVTTLEPSQETGSRLLITPPSRLDTPPEIASELTPARSLGYFHAESIGPETDADGPRTLEFRIADSALPVANHQDAVRLYRWKSGEWRPEPTRHFEADRYRATTNAGSLFAIGFTEPQFAITDVSVASRPITPGERLTVRITVSNDAAAGNTSFDLGTGTDTATRTVHVAREDTRQFEFTVCPEELGSVDIVVDGMTYATVTVDRSTTNAEWNRRRLVP